MIIVVSVCTHIIPIHPVEPFLPHFVDTIRVDYLQRPYGGFEVSCDILLIYRQWYRFIACFFVDNGNSLHHQIMEDSREPCLSASWSIERCFCCKDICFYRVRVCLGVYSYVLDFITR